MLVQSFPCVVKERDTNIVRVQANWNRKLNTILHQRHKAHDYSYSCTIGRL
jgi:hypothetical protein